MDDTERFILIIVLGVLVIVNIINIRAKKSDNIEKIILNSSLVIFIIMIILKFIHLFGTYIYNMMFDSTKKNDELIDLKNEMILLKAKNSEIKESLAMCLTQNKDCKEQLDQYIANEVPFTNV